VTLSLFCLDHTFPTPAENLAADEAFLDWCEESNAAGGLRFWEARQHFVVLGYSNHWRREVNAEACEADGIPILRRCSGGGTVLQGPGCLNYAVVLRIEDHPELEGIGTTNRYVMTRNARTLGTLLDQTVAVEGFTDLAVAGLKFSGNAQRRKRRCVLFHGTFLLDFNLDLIGRYLSLPARQPEYRRNRAHADFVSCLRLEREVIKAALGREWGAAACSDLNRFAGIEELVMSKYSRDDWNLRW
jgi:lipoate-protein ligase A